MKKQTKKLLENSSEKPFVSGESVFATRLSSNAFYGAFLSLTGLLTVLLYGGSMRIAHTDVAIASVDIRQTILSNKVEKLVAGYPIEQMTEYISKENKTTAAFLVGIAKKESNWGKRVPVDENGDDCFNYWGYRGAGSRGIAMGHGCFGSPEEAVGIVGGRLDTLIREYQFRTASDMIVWKCGFSCEGHNKDSVKKWIADVGYYKSKIEK